MFSICICLVCKGVDGKERQQSDDNIAAWPPTRKRKEKDKEDARIEGEREGRTGKEKRKTELRPLLIAPGRPMGSFAAMIDHRVDLSVSLACLLRAPSPHPVVRAMLADKLKQRSNF